MVELSVVVPAYNEEKNISLLYRELREILDKLNKDYEIIFIDDGSTDKTFEELKSLYKKDKKIRVIRFQKNFGKAAALSAGWHLAMGKFIIQLDADLQDDPKEIPRFLEKINRGYDLVSGWKFKRYDPITKTIPSKIFNWLTAKIIGVKLHDSNCGFKCYKKEVIQKIHIYGELHRYIPALVFWKGFRIGEIKVNHRPRKFGKSKYGFTRLFKGFLDLITVKYLTTYNKRPLHFFGFIGFIFGFLGFLSGIYLVYLKSLGHSISTRPLVSLTVLLTFLGVQFISLGLLGDMITSQSKGEEYVIREVLK